METKEVPVSSKGLERGQEKVSPRNPTCIPVHHVRAEQRGARWYYWLNVEPSLGWPADVRISAELYKILKRELRKGPASSGCCYAPLRQQEECACRK